MPIPKFRFSSFDIPPKIFLAQKTPRKIPQNQQGFFKTSVFEKASLDLKEKPVLWLVFPKPILKPTGF
jgi:hypothetical protein